MKQQELVHLISFWNISVSFSNEFWRKVFPHWQFSANLQEVFTLNAYIRKPRRAIGSFFRKPRSKTRLKVFPRSWTEKFQSCWFFYRNFLMFGYLLPTAFINFGTLLLVTVCRLVQLIFLDLSCHPLIKLTMPIFFGRWQLLSTEKVAKRLRRSGF